MALKLVGGDDKQDAKPERRTAQMLGGLRLGLTLGAGLILLALVIAMLARPA